MMMLLTIAMAMIRAMMLTKKLITMSPVKLVMSVDVIVNMSLV